MNENDTKRLSRLTAILTQLQSKRLITATSLADKFSVSVRTIYRDIRALEQSGVPIFTEDGKGYCIMDGYRISPVMFTEDEANALLSAEIIIEASNDESLIKEFSSAIQKIKAVFPNRLKERTEALEAKFAVAKTYTQTSNKSKYLLRIQKALIEHWVIKIEYTNLAHIDSVRELEPFAIYSNESDEWILIAHCRVRKEFRSFLLNRIQSLSITNDKFEPNPMTLTQYRKKVYGD